MKRASRIKTDEWAITIDGKAIKQMLQTSGLKQVDLAELLGVNPATMSRWGSENEKWKDDQPTSTTFLALIPLLLSAGIDLMPNHYKEAVTQEFSTAFSPQELKKNAPKIEKMARKRFSTTNPDLKRARRLFDALQEAWRIIDARQKEK